MTNSSSSAPEQLIRLLAPIDDEARAMARRLCRSRADGDDLFQESALRAMRKLHTPRDESRFRWWFYRVLFSVHRNRVRRDT
ncbi:MAG: sigma factor [Myxococcota bacterium]